MVKSALVQAFWERIHHIQIRGMKSSLGKNLTYLMLEKNITSQKLAKALGCSVTSINDWKSNRNTIHLSNLVKLCRYFNCSLDYLSGRTENDKKPSNFSFQNFGKSVRTVMKSKGITSYALRKETRFNSKYFNVWDKGTDPQLSTLIELANYFNCSLDELVGLE